MLGIEPTDYFYPPKEYDGDCKECGKPCDADIELCPPCLADAEHDAKCERDE